MEELVGGWDKANVAQAQLDLVVSELRHPDEVGPFAAFMRAMDVIGLKRGLLLDVGCGVGHYGVLCEKHYPGIIYYGVDASEEMIAQARQLAPMGRFRVCDFFDSGPSSFDIVLLSQVVEMLEDPARALGMAIYSSLHYVILNRMRLTSEKSHAIEEPTYCGNIGVNWLWNMSDIENIVAGNGTILSRDIWSNGNMATFVIEVTHALQRARR